jgi:hypothetical protein
MDYSNMPLEEKRLYYECGNRYVTLDQVQPWPDYVKDNHRFFTRDGTVLLMLFCTIKTLLHIKKSFPSSEFPLFIKPPSFLLALYLEALLFLLIKTLSLLTSALSLLTPAHV